MAQNDSIRVEIYDQVYNLRGSDEQYIQQLADYVDRKMRLVAEHTSTVDSLRVAVLAALNIADELAAVRAKYENASSQYSERAQSLRDALDHVLEDATPDTRRAG